MSKEVEPSCIAHSIESEAWKRPYCATCLRLKVEVLCAEIAMLRAAKSPEKPAEPKCGRCGGTKWIATRIHGFNATEPCGVCNECPTPNRHNNPSFPDGCPSCAEPKCGEDSK